MKKSVIDRLYMHNRAENPIVQRIVGLVKEKGKRERDLVDYLGLSLGSVSKWKHDGSYVYIKHIKEICEFLDATPNHLFFGSEDVEERLSSTGSDRRKFFAISSFQSLTEGRYTRERLSSKAEFSICFTS